MDSGKIHSDPQQLSGLVSSVLHPNTLTRVPHEGHEMCIEFVSHYKSPRSFYFFPTLSRICSLKREEETVSPEGGKEGGGEGGK